MIKDFCNDLNEYLIQEFKYKIPPARIHLNTIDVNRKKVELYIRYKTDTLIWQNDTLVLARLAFETRRKGNGRNLLSYFVNQAEKYDYKKIGLEQTNKYATAFAQKYGFKNLSENRHWIINVEDLKSELNKLEN